MEVNKKRWLCGGTAAALALALAVAGIVSSALEIFLTVTTVILSSRLVDCLRKLGGPDANSTCIMK